MSLFPKQFRVVAGIVSFYIINVFILNSILGYIQVGAFDDGSGRESSLIIKFIIKSKQL
jgi:hypothetical protein